MSEQICYGPLTPTLDGYPVYMLEFGRGHLKKDFGSLQSWEHGIFCACSFSGLALQQFNREVRQKFKVKNIFFFPVTIWINEANIKIALINFEASYCLNCKLRKEKNLMPTIFKMHDKFKVKRTSWMKKKRQIQCVCSLYVKNLKFACTNW